MTWTAWQVFHDEPAPLLRRGPVPVKNAGGGVRVPGAWLFLGGCRSRSWAAGYETVIAYRPEDLEAGSFPRLAAASTESGGPGPCAARSSQGTERN